MSLPRLLAIAAASAMFAGAAALPQRAALAEREFEYDVPYEPTSPEIVTTMLRLADVGPQDVVYDLGSGDGRIVIAAVRDFGARSGVGVDIDPERVAEARENADAAGVADRVTFIQGNLFQFDFRAATVVTMYLLPNVNMQLRPRILTELRPGTRVVSHRFDMEDWEADQTIKVGYRGVYFWVVPANVAGRWTWTAGPDSYSVELEQTFQKVRGRLHTKAGDVVVQNARLTGDHFRFEARFGERVLQFDGKVRGDVIEAAGGTVIARRVP